jgi:hypothetical protein
VGPVTITPEQLAEWDRYASEAAIGPWTRPSASDGVVTTSAGHPVVKQAHPCDARFIAAARTAMPALIARVRELEHALVAANAETRTWFERVAIEREREVTREEERSADLATTREQLALAQQERDEALTAARVTQGMAESQLGTPTLPPVLMPLACKAVVDALCEEFAPDHHRDDCPESPDAECSNCAIGSAIQVLYEVSRG